MSIRYDLPGRPDHDGGTCWAPAAPAPGKLLAAEHPKCWARSKAPTGEVIQCRCARGHSGTHAGLYETVEGARMHWWAR